MLRNFVSIFKRMVWLNKPAYPSNPIVGAAWFVIIVCAINLYQSYKLAKKLKCLATSNDLGLLIIKIVYQKVSTGSKGFLIIKLNQRLDDLKLVTLSLSEYNF